MQVYYCGVIDIKRELEEMKRRDRFIERKGGGVSGYVFRGRGRVGVVH